VILLIQAFESDRVAGSRPRHEVTFVDHLTFLRSRDRTKCAL
jgi:hypothetical protein